MNWADMESSDFSCEFCGKNFDQEEKFRAHCNSAEHRAVLVSDGGRTWRHRPPPRGVPCEELSICKNHQVYGQCRLGDQCCEAHSDDELGEWRERLEYRKARVKKAQEKYIEGYQEYAEELLRRYSEAKDPEAGQKVMTENLPGLKLTCKQQLKRTVTGKDTKLHWEFELHTITPLQRLVLLHDAFRGHFELRRVVKSHFRFMFQEGCQEWLNSLQPPGKREVLTYLIEVGFQASMYATFVQTLVFDFGGYPVLIRNFSVDMVPPDMLSSIEHTRRLVVTGKARWSPTTVDLVPYTERRSAKAQSLFGMYPVPELETFQLTQAVIGDTLTRENYKARMHELLYIEEMARADIIAQYNIRVSLEVTDSLSKLTANATEAHYAQGGELFALLRLEAEITEDTLAGRLVLQNCQMVWLAPVVVHLGTDKDNKPRVFELPIQLAKKDCVYIRLTKECVEEFQLQPRTSFEAEVQFLLDRLPMCEMHYAVDKLPMASLVFPDLSIRPPQCPLEWSLGWDPRLNEQQKRAVAAIVAPRTVPNVPPVLVVGPFGTGKTFTLAQALLEVIRRVPDSRVLVCTHSNSAADLYILEHLDKEVANQPALRPLRILYEYRMPNRVDRRLLQYCLEVPREQLSEQGPWFRQPTAEEIEGHRVVVTTLSSSQMILASGVKQGAFTHIFIDEAAQAMEAECILPLALANDNTRVVLAGDYMQLNPEVFSVYTRERRLHVSLLERLHGAFSHARGGKAGWHPCQVVLEDNYRSHEALVRFTSECFYGGHLRAVGSPGPHHLLEPLSFFAARGADKLCDGSTSYINEMEVVEVCEVVRQLVDKWSGTWGACDPSAIAVLTPYYDQVQCIRMQLRKLKLSRVRVESVPNVQGKQFRAVVLSTVRTRATCLPIEQAPFKAALNFGFLSDAKLLNTAITRAQSLVAVVGDPVSLCSVGSCRTLWEKFITTCAQRGSLYNMRWDEIKYQLDGFELKKEYGLNPHAQSFWPKHPFLDVPVKATADAQPQPRLPAAPGYNGLPPNIPFWHMPPPPMMPYYVPSVDQRFCGLWPRVMGFTPAQFHPNQGNASWAQGMPLGPYPSGQRPSVARVLPTMQPQQHYLQVHPQTNFQPPPPVQQMHQPQMLAHHQQKQQVYPQMPRQLQAEPTTRAKPKTQPQPHAQQGNRQQSQARVEQPKQNGPLLGINPGPSPSLNALSRAAGNSTGAQGASSLGVMDARFHNMMLNDDDNGDWTVIGAKKPAASGSALAPGSMPRKMTVADKLAAPLQRPGQPASRPSSQQGKQLTKNQPHAIGKASKTAPQAWQMPQQARSQPSRVEPGIRNQAPPVKEQVFLNSSVRQGARNRAESRPNANAEPKPMVAFVSAVSQPVTWGSEPVSKAQDVAGEWGAPSRRTIDNVKFGPDLYTYLRNDESPKSEQLAGAIKAALALPAQQASSAPEQTTTGGSMWGPIGSKPPERHKQSYSDVLRNGHVNGIAKSNKGQHNG